MNAETALCHEVGENSPPIPFPVEKDPSGELKQWITEVLEDPTWQGEERYKTLQHVPGSNRTFVSATHEWCRPFGVSFYGAYLGDKVWSVALVKSM